MEELVESFKGFILTAEQQENLRNSMRSVLSEEYYALTRDLFFDALNSKARYVVFMARRCFNLMNLFYRANFNEPDEKFERRVLSDSGLLANVPSIAYGYVAFGNIPQILIMDDILVHGRGINNLIDAFINALEKFSEDRGFEFPHEALERDVLKSITIRVMARNNKPLLMRSTYYRRLLADGYEPNIWEPKRWHELSSRISRLMSESIFSNTSFTFSLYSDKNTDVKCPVEEAVKRLGFIRSHWSKRFISDAWIKPLKRNNGDVTAFYTLRITQNMIDKTFCVVPFVLASDIDIDIYETLFTDVFGEKISNAIFGTHFSDKVSAEFVYLALSYNLLLLIQEECQTDSLITFDKLDIDKIFWNFGKDTIFANAINVLLGFKTPFLSWDRMDKYLLDATNDSEPLIRGNCENTLAVYHDVEEALEETIAYEGEEAERIACLEYSGQKSVSYKSKLNPIYSLLSKVNTKISLPNDNVIADLVGNFLRSMDRGYMAVSAKIEDHGGSQLLSCVYRAAEFSLFIHSKKYSDYLPVLIEMEKDCIYNCTRIVDRIDHFYEDKPEVKTKLKEYTIALYTSGQKIMDWDINWLHWTEVDDDTVRIFGNRSQDDLIISQVILRSLENAESMKRYRELYPKH